MNALRGHSNIQGLTDIGLMSNLLPGYLNLPTEKEPDYATLHAQAAVQAAAPGTDQLLAELQQVLRQLPEGDVRRRAATTENDWAYDYLPKLDVPTYDVLRAFELAKQGKMNGYVIQGFNPLMTFPNRAKMTSTPSAS